MGKSVYTGSFNISVENNLIIVTASGAWSKRTAERYVREFKPKVQTFCSEPWWQIVFLQDWILGTPAIEPIIGELSDWNLARNLRATAFVSSGDSLKRFQLENMLVDMPHGYQREYFNSREQALRWLEIQGMNSKSD